MFGEPFDSGLARAERHQQVADLPAAQAEYGRLLAFAEALDDSPDVRFLRGHLLGNLGIVRVGGTDLVGAGAAFEQSLALLHSVAEAPMGPRGRQLWLDVLLKSLIGRADLLRTTGHLDAARTCLEEAAHVLPGYEGDGTRIAELGVARVHLLMTRGEWGAAEELAAGVLATTAPDVVPARQRLQVALGLISASTGRSDLAEEHFAEAEAGFRATGDTAGLRQLVADRAYTAMRGGRLDLAERLYTRAASTFERLRQFGDLAVCEQARGFLAAARGDEARAQELMATSLARFERLGSALAAADTMLLSAHQARARGDAATMRHLCEAARAVYEEQGVYERCAQTDLLFAESIEDGALRPAPPDPATPQPDAPHPGTPDPRTRQPNAGSHVPGPERAAVDAALALALPAALALEAARFDFAGGHARSQWLKAAESAMALVFRLAVRRQDQGLLFELVEFRSAGAPLALDRTSAEVAAAPFPEAAMKAYPREAAQWCGGDAEAAASVGLRVAPPPRVLMSPGSDRTALQEYVEAAEARYHRRIVGGQEVPSW